MFRGNETVPTTQEVVRSDTRLRRWGRRLLLGAGLATAASLLGGGANLMLQDDNMKDFNDLKAFTSPEHQVDRCKTQEAFDAQVKMRKFFDEKGGVTDAEAELMAGVVGLEPPEIKALLGNELFPMDYDCGTPEASSSVVTKGLAAVAVGSGILIGSAGAGAYVAMRPRSAGKSEVIKEEADQEA